MGDQNAALVTFKNADAVEDRKPVPASLIHERKRKQHRDNDDVKPSKVKKCQIVSDPSQTQFTDLDIDCLEHMFRYLKFNDLLNVADLTESTTKAAQLVFSRRYSKHLIKLCGPGYETVPPIAIRGSLITISTASLCAKVLQSFGDVINKLVLVHFSDEMLTEDWSNLKSLLNEKCTKNLHELELVSCGDQMMNSIQNTFENVEFLRISCSHMGKFMDLGKWFPALVRLELLHNDRCVQIVSNFPHLSFLAMDIKNECLSTANVKAMIESVPQLQTLALSGGMKMSLLHFISESLPFLKRLYLWDFHLENESDNMIAFKNMEILSVSTGWLGMLPSKIPFECEKLTELRVSADTLGPEWIEFAMKQPNLTKLQLYSILDPAIDDDDFVQLAQMLPKLIEVDVMAEISSDALGHFLSTGKMLKKLRIKTFDGFNESLLNTWNIVNNNSSLMLERKTDH